MDKILTLCPVCRNQVDGSIVSDANSTYIQGSCSEHGSFQNKYFVDSSFYHHLKKIAQRYPPFYIIPRRIKRFELRNPEKNVSTVHIDFTQRCNLQCPTCFARSGPQVKTKEDVPVDGILQWLTAFHFPKHKPMIVILGGEPTLREDLFDLIKKLKEKGYVVRLSTNGLKLLDKEYVKQLKNAGLDWVLLQFDGFNSEASKYARGKDLVHIKLNILQNLKEAGLLTHLIVMITSQNDDEMYHILEFAFKHPQVFAVNFYPLANIGRNSLNVIHVEDLLKKLEFESNGTIQVKDFLTTKKILLYLYRFTKKAVFRSKMCTHPIFLIRIRGKIYPINRFLNPLFAIKNFKAFLRFMVGIKNILKFDSKPSKDLMYLNIEDFYDSNCINMNEAFNCHNVYLTPRGLIPLCIYNVILRTDNTN